MYYISSFFHPQFMLSKYGYLRCHVARRRREASHRHNKNLSHSNNFPSVLANVEEGGGETCDETEIQKAIRNYQRTYNLPETGELDEETKSLMSTSRCGNKDSEKDHVKDKNANKEQKPAEETLLLNTSRTPLTKRSTVDSSVQHQHKQLPLQTHNLRKRSAQTGNSKLYRILAGEKPTARSIKYHQRHIDDYIKRIRSEAKGNQRLFHRYTPRERRKRSIHVNAPGGHTVGKFQGDKGALFSKDVIRWRLVTTGFSTRIPVEDQRGTLDLAFRMWSEVIPLKFIEDTSSDIDSVDIEIAFGKGQYRFLVIL